MKKTITIALVAILAIALMTGCAAATTATTAEADLSGQSVSTTARNEATQLGAGYRGGNSDAGAGADSSDSCEPIDNSATTADPNYDLSEENKTLSLSGYGSEGALADEALTLADMLTYAIQDEYLARAEYSWIIDSFGSVRPFTNIMQAEETHIAALLPLFETYGIAAPVDEGASLAVAVASLTEAYQAGVNAEVNNIAMYETFLDQDLPDNVRAVFESLMRASENHLRAFQNQL